MECRSCTLLFLILLSCIYTVKAPTPDLAVIVEVTAKRKTYTDKELYLLARLVYAESGGEPYDGKLAVANVVVNRMQRKGYTLKEVIYQKGQFDGIRSKRFKAVYKGEEVAFQECLKAAETILEGERVIPYSVQYFHNPVTSTDNKWIRHIERYKYKKIGRHLFCHNPKELA